MEEHDRSFEPMDIDLSLHSNSKMDISLDDFSEPIKAEPDMDSTVQTAYEVKPTIGSNIKKFHINLQEKVKSKRVMKIRIVSVLSILLISIALYNIINISCSEEIDLDNLKNSLLRALVGQTKAIDSIVESLGEKEKTKIIFLYGGTGVGKTLTASLIMESFGYTSNLYHYTLPSFVKSMSTDIMFGLILCPNSLIVIDDCDSTYTNLPKDLSDLILKSVNLDKNITIILIYNCDNFGDKYVKTCDDQFYTALSKNFSNIKAKKKFIEFEPLTEIHLRECIEKEIGNTISEEAFGIISKNFDVTVDGCKGVHTKIKLLNVI